MERQTHPRCQKRHVQSKIRKGGEPCLERGNERALEKGEDADECRSPEEVGSPADEVDVMCVNEIWRELVKLSKKNNEEHEDKVAEGCGSPPCDGMAAGLTKGHLQW